MLIYDTGPRLCRRVAKGGVLASRTISLYPPGQSHPDSLSKLSGPLRPNPLLHSPVAGWIVELENGTNSGSLRTAAVA